MAADTSGTTIVAKGTKVTGTIEIECKFHIDGQVEGTIRSSNVVTVGSSGSVKGEIYAEKLVVNGELDGNADCANVEILAGGKVNGDLVSSNLIIEAQAVFEGYSKIRVAGGGNSSPFSSSSPSSSSTTIASVGKKADSKE